MNVIVFDFDGPLFDSRQAAKQALADTQKQFKNKINDSNIRFDDIPLLQGKYLISLFLGNQEISPLLFNEILDFYKHKRDYYENEYKLNPAIIKILNKAIESNIRLALLSLRNNESLNKLILNLGIKDFFEVIISSDSITSLKPSGEGLLKIADVLKVDPKTILFIGNTDVDYLAAKEIGCLYYHTSWSGEPANTAFINADDIVTNFQELDEIVESFEYNCDISKSVIPVYLKKIIESKEFSIFAGAGISIPSGIGNWHTHYNEILSKLGSGMISKKIEITECLQLLAANQESRKLLFDEFRKSFNKPEISPNEYHYSIIHSKPKYIWTTNYDNLFEKTIIDCNSKIKVITNDEEYLDNFTSNELLIKINGDFTTAKYDDSLDWNIVFTQEQFDVAEHKRKELWGLFENIYRNNCIIFIGLSFTDPALRRIITLARNKIKRTKFDHFILAVRPVNPIDRKISNLFSKSLLRSHIRTLFFNSYEEILLFVKSIAVLSYNPSICISGSLINNNNEIDISEVVKLPNSILEPLELVKICSNIGRNLAILGFEIISGGAPFIGVPAVESALEINQSKSRFYLRKKKEASFNRIAPSVIVEGTDYKPMRRTLISNSTIVIAIGGVGDNRNKSGVAEEIELAIINQKAVIIFTQAGGICFEYFNYFIECIKRNISNIILVNLLIEINMKVYQMNKVEFLNYLNTQLSIDINHILVTYISGKFKES
jgi:phosphoglycolate phosphatase-like HAD superfamily hydrolase